MDILDSEGQVLAKCGQLHDTAYLQGSALDTMLLICLHCNAEDTSCLSAAGRMHCYESLKSTKQCSLLLATSDNCDQEVAFHKSARLPAAQT